MTKTLEQPKWITKLPTCKTSADFIAALEGLYSDNFAAKARREVLKAEQDVALFAGKDTAEILRKLNDVTREIEDNDTAINGAISRRDAAIVAERNQHRQDLKNDSDTLGKRYAELLKLQIVHAQVLLDCMAETDLIEQGIQSNNDEIESSGVTNDEKFTQKTNISKLRRENLKPTFVPESQVPKGLSVTGAKWARFWLRLMTSAKINPPE